MVRNGIKALVPGGTCQLRTSVGCGGLQTLVLNEATAFAECCLCLKLHLGLQFTILFVRDPEAALMV